MSSVTCPVSSGPLTSGPRHEQLSNNPRRIYALVIFSHTANAFAVEDAIVVPYQSVSVILTPPLFGDSLSDSDIKFWCTHAPSDSITSQWRANCNPIRQYMKLPPPATPTFKPPSLPPTSRKRRRDGTLRDGRGSSSSDSEVDHSGGFCRFRLDEFNSQLVCSYPSSEAETKDQPESVQPQPSPCPRIPSTFKVPCRMDHFLDTGDVRLISDAHPLAIDIFPDNSQQGQPPLPIAPLAYLSQGVPPHVLRSPPNGGTPISQPLSSPPAQPCVPCHRH